MPRTGQGSKPTPKSEQARLLWGVAGARNEPLLTEWDPKQVELVDALLEVIQSGATVVLRPGSGGRSIGIAIWEGDTRHAPTWCYDGEELDQWAKLVNDRAREIKGQV